jgi:hypothetical protein
MMLGRLLSIRRVRSFSKRDAPDPNIGIEERTIWICEKHDHPSGRQVFVRARFQDVAARDVKANAER